MTDPAISKKDLMGELGCSLNTYKKWCRAWNIPTDQQVLSQIEADRIRDAQTRTQVDGLVWADYLAEIADDVPTPEPEPLDLVAELLPRYRQAGKILGQAIAADIIAEIDREVMAAIVTYAQSNPLNLQTIEAPAFLLEGNGE